MADSSAGPPTLLFLGSPASSPRGPGLGSIPRLGAHPQERWTRPGSFLGCCRQPRGSVPRMSWCQNGVVTAVIVPPCMMSLLGAKGEVEAKGSKDVARVPQQADAGQGEARQSPRLSQRQEQLRGSKLACGLSSPQAPPSSGPRAACNSDLGPKKGPCFCSL